MPDRSIYQFDWGQVNLRAGVLAVLALVGTAVVLVMFGSIGLAVGFAAMFVIMADGPGATRTRLVVLASFIALGSVLALGAAWAGTTRPVLSSMIMAVIVYLATLAAALGRGPAVRGLLLSIWVILALALSGSVDAPAELSLAFLAGGGLALGVVLIRSVVGDQQGEPEERQPLGTLGAQVTGPLGRFAVIRAITAGAAVYVGTKLFPEHPIWAVVAVVVIMREERGATLEIGLLRTWGTFVGVIAAGAMLLVVGDVEWLVWLLFLVSGFSMIALQKVNYALFTLFLTALMVFALHGTGSDALAGGVDRLLATLVGAAMAIGAIAVFGRRPAASQRA